MTLDIAAQVAERQEALYGSAVSAHGAALERLARSYEADADKRQDLLQEIHLALWRSLSAARIHSYGFGGVVPP